MSARTFRVGRAFTLVELMVVISVMVLGAVAIIPSFIRYHHRAQFTEAARKTMALAVEARGLAAARDTVVSLHFDPVLHGMRLAIQPTDADAEAAQGPPDAAPLGERRSPDTRLLEYPLDVEVTLEGRDPATQPAFRFYPDGRADLARMVLKREGFDPLVLATNPRTGRLAVVEERP